MCVHLQEIWENEVDFSSSIIGSVFNEPSNTTKLLKFMDSILLQKSRLENKSLRRGEIATFSTDLSQHFYVIKQRECMLKMLQHTAFNLVNGMDAFRDNAENRNLYIGMIMRTPLLAEQSQRDAHEAIVTLSETTSTMAEALGSLVVYPLMRCLSPSCSSLRFVPLFVTSLFYFLHQDCRWGLT